MLSREESTRRICHECGNPTHDYTIMAAHGGTMLAPVCSTHLHAHLCPTCDRVIACVCKSYDPPGEGRVCSVCKVKEKEDRNDSSEAG